MLALLLYATFLSIPFGRLGRAFKDWRFLTTVLVVNFVLVPLVVWPLSRIVAGDQALFVGVLFVLLTRVSTTSSSFPASRAATRSASWRRPRC